MFLFQCFSGDGLAQNEGNLKCTFGNGIFAAFGNCNYV